MDRGLAAGAKTVSSDEYGDPVRCPATKVPPAGMTPNVISRGAQ